MSKKWTPEVTKSLVELYELQPVLYKVDSPNYQNKVQRFNALQSIKMELENIYKIELSETDILKKINNLRSQFLDCLRTKKKTPASGSGAETKSVWWLYNHLQFLIPFCNKDRGKSNMQACEKKREMIEKPEETPFNIDENEDDVDLTLIFENKSDEEMRPESASSVASFQTTPTPTPTRSSSSTSVHPQAKTSQENVEVTTPSNKKRRRKQSSTDMEDYMKTAIDDIVKSSKTQDNTPRDIKSLCNLIETELMSIKNKNVFKKLKWGILDLIRQAQDEDEID